MFPFVPEILATLARSNDPGQRRSRVAFRLGWFTGLGSSCILINRCHGLPMFNGLKLVCVDLSMNIVEYTRLLVFNLVALITKIWG